MEKIAEDPKNEILVVDHIFLLSGYLYIRNSSNFYNTESAAVIEFYFLTDRLV